MLIKTEIFINLKKIVLGVWSGKVDTARVWAHYETLHFMNYKKSEFSRRKVLRSFDELTKGNL